MSLDRHSFGDGAAHAWAVPALRPLPARRQAHWSLTPSGCLLLNSSGGPPKRGPPLAATYSTRAYTALPIPHGVGGLTRSSLHLSGLAPTMPVAQDRSPEGNQQIPDGSPLNLGDRSIGCRVGVRRWR